MKTAGFTLIELMIAIAITAMLGVIGYRALDAATASQQRLAAELDRWRDIGRFVQRAEADLWQLTGRPRSPGGDLRLTRATDAGVPRSELSFLAGDGAGERIRRCGFRFDRDRVLLLRWPGTDAASPPREDRLLDRVRDLRFRLRLADGRVVDHWPVANDSTDVLPTAVDMELELHDADVIHRLLPLR